METLGAVLVSVGLVVGGLLLVAVLVWVVDLGRRDSRRPWRGTEVPVAVDGACEPGRGSDLRGVRRGVGQAVEQRSW
jgi:hypothetical protein